MSMRSRKEDRLPAGWSRQGLQVPTHLANAFRQTSALHGAGGVKVQGTLAVALLLGLPDDVRAALFRYIALESMVKPGDIDPDKVWGVLAKAMRRRADAGGAESDEWYIDRILDPELTPPPGEKATDKDGGDPGVRKGA